MGSYRFTTAGIQRRVYDVRFTTAEATLNFFLFARSECPLCEAMEDELRPFISDYNITVKRIYIDNNPALIRRYGSKIPVLARNDEVLCEYFLDSERLIRYIESENQH